VYTADGAHWRGDALLVRTRAPAQPLVPALRRLVRAEAPELPVGSLGTLADLDREAQREVMRIAGGAAAVGVLALGLASIGLYALVALTVGQRTREIGVRLALGGSPRRVAGTFFASGLRLALVALLVGLPVSVLALKVVLSRVIAPAVSLPAVGGGIALAVLAVAAAATWLPARRAASLDPLRALRTE
jgi:ABC-type antimicrobial peptide transport system permease subunit